MGRRDPSRVTVGGARRLRSLSTWPIYKTGLYHAACLPVLRSEGSADVGSRASLRDLRLIFDVPRPGRTHSSKFGLNRKNGIRAVTICGKNCSAAIIVAHNGSYGRQYATYHVMSRYVVYN